MRTTSPVPGAGPFGTLDISRAYIRPWGSKARPRTVVSPVATVLTVPVGITSRMVDVPGVTGKELRVPT